MPPRGPNLADVQFRETSTFPAESRLIPAVHATRGGPGGGSSLLGATPARHAPPERAAGANQASGTCLAPRARSKSSARAARAAPPRAPPSSLGRRLDREHRAEDNQGLKKSASKHAMAPLGALERELSIYWNEPWSTTTQ